LVSPPAESSRNDVNTEPVPADSVPLTSSPGEQQPCADFTTAPGASVSVTPWSTTTGQVSTKTIASSGDSVRGTATWPQRSRRGATECQLASGPGSSVLPAVSVARTRNVCSPKSRLGVCTGDWQGAKGAPSRLHANVLPGSSAENAMSTGPVGTWFLGADWIVVVGATVSAGSERHERCAGVASVLPAASTARTSSAWSPAEGAATCSGETQTANAPPSSRHSKLEPPSDDVKRKSTGPAATSPDGPSAIVVSGATVSTVQAARGGWGSTLPAASTARTSNV
jgi:hypothetical protein